MGLMGTEGVRASESGAGREGNASPAGSICATDFMPPSPCLHEIGDDDATPRQQWSPVHTVGGGTNPARTRGYSAGSAGGGTFAGAGEGRGAAPGNNSSSGGSAPKVAPSAGTFASSNTGSNNHNCAAAATAAAASVAAASAVAVLHQRHSPDSPVMRVDLERLDLSVLALGEEGGPTVPSHRLVASEDRTGELLHPGAFRSEPGPIGQGGRPRSLGGRPSRVHALFVAPGQLGTGPASPPSSYSTHSESGFASPTARLASPFGVGGGSGGREYHHYHHHHHHHHQQGRVKKGHWKKGKPIGVGSCGNVYLGMNEDTGELMAVKEITLETKDRLLTSLYNEIQVMHKLVHPHIVGYLGAELQDSKRRLCIFQEWVPAGSLHSLLGQFGALSDAMTRKYTKQVLEGLVYLHANRVIHRDVKSKNILVDDRGNVKLADFGCALVLKDDNGDGVEMSMKGTPLFMAPEMLLKRKCGKRVDVWSLGCAVLEMLTTRPPWADTFKHPVEIIEHFSSNPGPPPLPENLSPTLRDFLLSCFTWDASRRPTSLQLSGHEYLRAPRPSGDGGGSSSGGGGGGGGGGPDSGDDNDIPLEAMGRAPFISRMRRCSSATLPELLHRSNALGGVGGVDAATFGTAPPGTLRPPSPRYGPGGVAGPNGSKRTPTRRRVYTESSSSSSSAMPPPESSGVKPAVSAAATVGAGAFSHAAAVTAVQDGAAPTRGLVRRSSMPNARSPPASPERPRRPGRGLSPGRASNSALALALLPQQLAEEEGRMGSGPTRHARLRSTGDARALGGGGHWSAAAAAGIGDGRFARLGHGGGVGSRGTSGSSAGGTDSADAAWAARTPAGVPVGSASFTIAGAGGGGGGASQGHCIRQAAPTPKLPPIVRELLGTLEHSGGEEARGGGTGVVVRSGDSPPPTVRPLELRRSVSAQSGHVSWGAGGSSPAVGDGGSGVSERDANHASTKIASSQQQQQQRLQATGAGGGIWGATEAEGEVSDALDGGGVAGSHRPTNREGGE